jgi:hypothetical protein
MPVFTPLVALISSLVGYQIPVVCQPLPQGTTIQAAISVSAPGYAPFSGQHSWGPTMADAGGVTGPLGYLPPGATVTITVDGVTATLPRSRQTRPIRMRIHPLPDTPAGSSFRLSSRSTRATATPGRGMISRCVGARS